MQDSVHAGDGVLPVKVAGESLVRMDERLVQIVDAALVDAAERSGAWLVCRPGCFQCCVGVFAISQADAARLQRGFGKLLVDDPERAMRVRARVEGSAERMAESFPGDPISGILDGEEESQEAFEIWANDEVCPVLDPTSGTCDLYEARPTLCRTFGPPVRTDHGGVGVCELCFVGAPEEVVLSAEMNTEFRELEEEVTAAEEHRSGLVGETIIAFALRDAVR